MLAARVACASYGAVVREAYSPALHVNEDVSADQCERDNLWVTNRIEWLIKKGDKVNPDVPLIKPLQIRLASGELTRAWNTTIVISHCELTLLPKSMK